MKNITINVDEEVYRKALKRAEELRRTVSELVADFLESLGRENATATAKKRQLNELLDRVQGSVGRKISRNDLYDRPRLS